MASKKNTFYFILAPFTFVIALTACDTKVSDTTRPQTVSAASIATTTHNPEQSLSLPMRLAFMAGHVEAGLALYRAGELEMAAPHLLHPISEIHKEERVGLQKLGLDVVSFVAVSAALEANRAAFEIEPLLNQAESNLKMLADRAGGDPIEIIDFLLEMIAEEYTIAVGDRVITDIGEYQDAFGFRVAASKQALLIPEGSMRQFAVEALEGLGSLWLDGPKPVARPTSAGVMADRVSTIREKLSE
jgi:hypothetical protein